MLVNLNSGSQERQQRKITSCQDLQKCYFKSENSGKGLSKAGILSDNGICAVGSGTMRFGQNFGWEMGKVPLLEPLNNIKVSLKKHS